ncbi:MAG: HNH endonuclease [Acidimicrobiia bacterium]|nr:HNH endonuclease [Acidimicrobiia bacterium]
MEVDVDNTFLAETSAAELDQVPLERLEAELIGWAGHLAAATARWLLWLAAYDRREGWGQWGCRSAAHWLSWKCGMSLHTARVHVRVARVLEDLPLVAAAFVAGELSFSKVRALTRLHRPFNELEMVEAARTATASQLDRIVAGCRQLTDADDDSSRADGAGRVRYRQRELPDGTVEIVLVVTAPDAEAIDTAIQAAADRKVAERDPAVTAKEHIDQRGGWDEIKANAATELLTGTHEHEGPDPVELVVEVGLAPTSNDDAVEGACAISGRYLPNSVVRRLGCDAVIATSRDPSRDTTTTGVGRRQRVVPAWLRRLLERRDHHTCQFPGCTTRRRLHAHHIIHWLDHGPTELENLILLCSFHHHLVHEGGWSITGPAGSHQIRRPDGEPIGVPHHQGRPEALAPVAPASASALEAWWAGEQLDIQYAISVYADNGTIATNPSSATTPGSADPTRN